MCFPVEQHPVSWDWIVSLCAVSPGDSLPCYGVIRGCIVMYEDIGARMNGMNGTCRNGGNFLEWGEDRKYGQIEKQ